MLKIHHITLGTACALLATSTVPAAEQLGKASQKSGQQKNKQEVDTGDTHLVAALAEWISDGNKGEIALGRLASQKATSPEVKQFAQRMVTAHTAFLKKLQKFTMEKARPTHRHRRPEDLSKPHRKTPRAKQEKQRDRCGEQRSRGTGSRFSRRKARDHAENR